MLLTISNWILPAIMIAIVIYGLFKKVNVFSCFIEGAKEGIDTLVAILPALVGLVVAVSMLRASGALEAVAWLLSPVAKLLGMPEDVIPLALISPISGSGSLAMLESIVGEAGVDSLSGKIAYVITSSTETTFYAVTLYYGTVGITKTRHTVPAALLADMTSYVVSAMAVRYFLM